jgi:hypothetical protein
MGQAIDIAAKNIPYVGMTLLWLKTGRGGGGVTIPGNLASGWPGGKIEVARRRSPSPLAILFQIFTSPYFFRT